MDLKKINRRTFESLIMSGAFDKLGPHRAALTKNLEDALKASDQHAKDEASGQSDMFGVLTETHEEVENAYANTPPYTEKQILDGERETLGLLFKQSSDQPLFEGALPLQSYAFKRISTESQRPNQHRIGACDRLAHCRHQKR